MKKHLNVILIVSAAIVGFLSAWFFVGGSPAKVAGDVSAKKVGKSVIRYNSAKKRITEVRLDEARKTVRIVESEVKRPDVIKGTDLDLRSEEEALLSEAQKSVLIELQAALDANDLRKVRKALSKFVASSSSGKDVRAGVGGASGGSVPRCMRMRAVEALGWFGKEAITDLAEYIADSDPEVAENAMGQFSMALSDCTMSDRELSSVVKASMKVLHDADSIDTLMSELGNMRNSVKAETAIDILASGTPEAQAVLKEQMEFYFDGDVTSTDGIQKWQAENPDDENDEEFYAGEKPEPAGSAE